MDTTLTRTPLQQLEDAEMDVFQSLCFLHNNPFADAYADKHQELVDKCLRIIHESTIEVLEYPPEVVNWESEQLRRRMAALEKSVMRKVKRLRKK